MNAERDRDIELMLKNALPPLPPGLRGRILDGAEKRKAERASLTPLLRIGLTVSVFVFAAALAGDAVLAHREAIRTAVFFGPAVRPAAAAEDPIMQADVLAVIPQAETVFAERKARSGDRSNSRQFRLKSERALIEEETDAL